MKTTQLISALAAAVLSCTAGSVMAASSDYRTVIIQNEAVCVAEGEAAPQCFARDGKRKALPLWSKDGNRIAVIADPAGAAQLATLAVFDRHGQQLTAIAIKPVAPDEVSSGMRAVEYLEWIDQHRILVGGAINPSSGEYLLIDTASGKVLKEWVDDGGGIAISPDGNHVAAITGAPHFASADARAPKLLVDGEEVLALAPLGATPEGRPLWSPDSSSVAQRMRGNDQRAALLVWSRTKRTHSYTQLPASAQGSARVSLRWRNGDLLASSAASSARPGRPETPPETVALLNATDAAASKSFTRVQGPAPNGALQLRRQLVTRAERQGGRGADVWCAACELISLPRAAGAMAETD